MGRGWEPRRWRTEGQRILGSTGARVHRRAENDLSLRWPILSPKTERVRGLKKSQQSYSAQALQRTTQVSSFEELT